MRVLVDLNVILDFLQEREPFYESAAEIFDNVLYGKTEGVLAAHAVPTIDYLMRKAAPPVDRREALQWLLSHFDVAAVDGVVLRAAATSAMGDFEDAVTAFSAQSARCECVVTRNVSDFAESPLPAILPSDLLRR